TRVRSGIVIGRKRARRKPAISMIGWPLYNGCLDAAPELLSAVRRCGVVGQKYDKLNRFLLTSCLEIDCTICCAARRETRRTPSVRRRGRTGSLRGGAVSEADTPTSRRTRRPAAKKAAPAVPV